MAHALLSSARHKYSGKIEKSRHDNVQYLEKLKKLTLFIERSLEKDAIPLSFYNQPDGPITSNGSFQSSTLVPGGKEAFYVGPPTKEKLPKYAPEGSVLIGPISYGRLSFGVQNEEKNPVSYLVSYIVPPNKPEEAKETSSATSKKSVCERLEEEVRDAKIKVLASLKLGTDEERSEWKKLSSSLKSEYPKYTPLLSKILGGLLSADLVEDTVLHYNEVVRAADEVIDSIDRDELARYFSLKSDPDDEGAAEKIKKMETTREQLVEALYQKGLALSEIERLKQGEKTPEVSATEGVQRDLFEENFKELKKWVELKTSKYGTLLVLHEIRSGRLGTALKVTNEIIQDAGEPPKKKLYELKLTVLRKIGWTHLISYEKEWMFVRFPASLPLF